MATLHRIRRARRDIYKLGDGFQGAKHLAGPVKRKLTTAKPKQAFHRQKQPEFRAKSAIFQRKQWLAQRDE
jgi:hypothetical protein